MAFAQFNLQLFSDVPAFDGDEIWLMAGNLFNQLWDITSGGERDDAKLLGAQSFQDPECIASDRTGRT